MDIYKYLNSRDVAKHCRQLNWRFNALEMAFIVYYMYKGGGANPHAC